MYFGFSPEDEAFRQEVRAFIEKEWRPIDKGYDTESIYTGSWDREDRDAQEVRRRLEKKLVARGWWTMHWPKEYGGQEAPIGRQLVYREEMAYQGAPAELGGSFIAPVIMLHGKEWQKKEFLPRIAGADLDFVQGFTEPNAGSDLASLQTRAVRDGDDYIVTGQKCWISSAHLPHHDWGHFLVRTDPSLPKHKGISYLLIDMRSPGVAVRPLYDGFGRYRHNEVFLDQVRVPARNLIGEENQGWYAAMTALSFERSMIDRPARLLRALEQFLDYARDEAKGAILKDPIARHQLANFRMELEINRMFAWRVGWLQSKGDVPVREASMSKLWTTELGQRLFRRLARIMREHGNLLPRDQSGWRPLGGYVASNAFLCYSNSIGGGSSEIQRNILAQRSLGLPR